MKGLLGQGNLAWDTEKQQGVFAGHAVYDGETGTYNAGGPFAPPPPPQQQPQQQPPPPPAQRRVVFGGESSAAAEPEYPNPGSVASCDACGTVVNRYYHCYDCQEATGLFDLCVRCCGAIYLKQGAPITVNHPTHDYNSHRMAHIIPPAAA